jgi:hypothetical protein
MAKKKLKWYEIDEASVVAAIKGVQLPIGAQSKKGKKKKKKSNPSKPYGEEEMFEGRELGEGVERIPGTGDPSGKGAQWTVRDPRTNTTHGSYGSRDEARKAAEQLGITVKRKPGTTGGGSKDSQKRPPAKQRKPKKTAFESLVRNILKKRAESQIAEGSSMISYMFEQAPTTTTSLWETVVSKLPREVVMSDEGLSEVIRAVAVAEARVLAKSVMEIKKCLEGAGPFMVERKEADQDPDTGDIRMPFVVQLGESVKDNLLFAIKLEHGKPMVLFPEDSRQALNNMLTTESKMLRAELMHVQETILDGMNDVIEAGLSRDTYLEQMQGRLQEVLGEMNLVETMLLKNLVREKLRGAKK